MHTSIQLTLHVCPTRGHLQSKFFLSQIRQAKDIWIKRKPKRFDGDEMMFYFRYLFFCLAAGIFVRSRFLYTHTHCFDTLFNHSRRCRCSQGWHLTHSRPPFSVVSAHRAARRVRLSPSRCIERRTEKQAHEDQIRPQAKIREIFGSL